MAAPPPTRRRSSPAHLPGLRPRLRLALATCRPLPEPDLDEPLLLAALRARGVEARMHAWEDGVPADAELVVLRSTWNYFHRPDDFVAWARAVGPRLVNPPEVVAWNVDKRYLLELARAGLPVVPTVVLERGARVEARDLADLVGGGEGVVKPVISAGSHLTERFDARALAPGFVDALNGRLAERAMLVQPYVPSVETYGERSVVLIDGEISHVVRKSPRFLQDDESVRAVDGPTAAERRFAEAAFRLGRELAPGERLGELAYARVDLAHDAGGEPMLMELELIEPSLFFTERPDRLDAFVDALLRRVAPP